MKQIPPYKLRVLIEGGILLIALVGLKFYEAPGWAYIIALVFQTRAGAFDVSIQMRHVQSSVQALRAALYPSESHGAPVETSPSRGPRRMSRRADLNGESLAQMSQRRRKGDKAIADELGLEVDS